MNKQPLTLLRMSIGLIYLWFGMLKFFPNLSPAEDLAKNTMQVLTFHLVPVSILIFFLAIWETLIGCLLLIGKFPKISIQMALFHMAATFTPFLLLPELTFQHSTLYFTLLGQYILKNLVIVCALLTLLNFKDKPIDVAKKQF